MNLLEKLKSKLKMLKKIKKKIEQKRSSKKLHWKLLVIIKDCIWFPYGLFKKQIKRFYSRKKIFEDIYKKSKWGKREKFFSGIGSLAENSIQDRTFITDFIRQHKIKTVLDLGCGDFRVGKMIDWNGAEYIGIDIVKPLVEYNNKKYSNKKIRFLRKDIVVDELPDAELCILRTVFQHLSNKEILKILPKLKKYKHIIVIDGKVKDNDERINYNQITGNMRLNGLHLDLPPFNLNVKIRKEYTLTNKKDILRIMEISF